MSNFHFDLSFKLPQGEVHDISGEVQKFLGEVQKFLGEVQNDLRGGAHLPSKSGHEAKWCAFDKFQYLNTVFDNIKLPV